MPLHERQFLLLEYVLAVEVPEIRPDSTPLEGVFCLVFRMGPEKLDRGRGVLDHVVLLLRDVPREQSLRNIAVEEPSLSPGLAAKVLWQVSERLELRCLGRVREHEHIPRAPHEVEESVLVLPCHMEHDLPTHDPHLPPTTAEQIESTVSRGNSKGEWSARMNVEER